MAVTTFSQRDPRWRDNFLGTSPLTLGAAGCLVTAIAALLCDLGVTTDPGRLNAWLTKTRGYVADNLFVFNAISGLGVDCLEVVLCADVPAPVATLQELLRPPGTYGVVVQVDFQAGGPLDQHWVRLLALDQVMDPWQLPGDELQPLARYLAPGWDAARGIFMVAWYEKVNGRRFITPVAVRWSQPQIALWRPSATQGGPHAI